MLKFIGCYATHKLSFGRIETPIRIRLKPNAHIITRRPSEVPHLYRNKLDALLKEVEKHKDIKQIVSSPQVRPIVGTTYLNPLIITPRRD